MTELVENAVEPAKTPKVRKIKLDKNARRAEYLVGDILYQAYIPEGFKGRVKSGLDILERARALLAEEGEEIKRINRYGNEVTDTHTHWTKGKWFKNLHPELDPEDAFCNNWQVCMDGALFAVSIGQAHYLNPVVHPLTNADPSTTPWHAVNETGKLGPEMKEWVTEAQVYVAKAGMALWPKYTYRYKALDTNSQLAQSVITDANDNSCTTRTQALNWLDKAIELYQADHQTIN